MTLLRNENATNDLQTAEMIFPMRGKINQQNGVGKNVHALYPSGV